MKAVLKAFLLLIVSGLLLLFVTFMWIGSRGVSARGEPGTVEKFMARTMRRLAVPRNDRNRQNPVAATPDVIAEGMAHFADHCAACHANDGSGETQIGLGLYPRPPDLRLRETQSLTDGELFYTIENGVRLTGMPAWGTGTPESAEETWHIVHFIRRLPTLSPDQLAHMASLNPKSAAESNQKPDSFARPGQKRAGHRH